jgi:hypothetical protein
VSKPLFIFLAFILLASAVIWLAVGRLRSAQKLKVLGLPTFFRKNYQGLLLAVIFFIVYWVLASIFNRVDFNNNNVFFAADTHQWQLRIASADGYLMEMRAIHPLAFLILRPMVFAISFLSGSDLFHSALFLLSLTASSGVFLAWVFIKRAVGNAKYAFLFASLLGISTAQLMFNTVTETYIFSGFLLILFFVLLQKQSSFIWLVLSGVGVFGITISNLVQSVIGLFLSDLKIKRALLFAVSVVAIGAGLSFVNRAIYQNSGLFFRPADYGVESQHYLEIGDAAGWLARARLVGSDMFLFSVVAPKPFLQIYHRDDDHSEFPKFNFKQAERLSQFAGTGKIAVWVWLGIFFAAVISFSRSLWQERFTFLNRLGLAFLGCLAFNFVFHLIYGFEPFLYSADWTYALVFFAAIGLRPLAEDKWMQIALLILLALLTLNNLSFLYLLMNGISPFIPGA